MLSRVKRWWQFGAVGLLLFAFLLFPSAAHADTNYGEGLYGKCDFQQACEDLPDQTIVDLPGGLQVAINLEDGQVIPFDGYAILVTPLNGQGETFRQVAFYIDGVLLHTAFPDAQGTATWFWDPREFPGSTVKIVITAENGKTFTREFTVKVEDAPKEVEVKPDPGLLGNLADTLRDVVNAIPQPVVYAFPYFLFVLLGIDMMLLTLQSQREIKEMHGLRRRLAREQLAAAAKKSFIQLASHYLRTPLTLVEGGVDLLTTDQAFNTDTVSRLKTALKNLHDKIENLLSQSQTIRPDQGYEAAYSQSQQSIKLWKMPGLFVPVILIGVLALAFNYLAFNVGSFSGNQIDFIIQIAVYVVLAVTFYLIFRRLQLRRREVTDTQRIIDDERALNEARDAFITGTTTNLHDDLEVLQSISSSLPDGQAKEFITEGQSRFRDVLAKFGIAGQLRGGRSTDPFAPASLSEVVNRAMQSVGVKAEAKHVAVTTPNDLQFSTRNVRLFTYVVASTLDNAIAYTSDNTTVDVIGAVEPTGFTIRIADKGPGITPQRMATLFQPFGRIDDVEAFTHEGLGFSLYLNRLIMNHLGGDISVDQNVKTGTTVILHLPPFTQ